MYVEGWGKFASQLRTGLYIVLLYESGQCTQYNLHVHGEIVCLTVDDVQLLALFSRHGAAFTALFHLP